MIPLERPSSSFASSRPTTGEASPARRRGDGSVASTDVVDRLELGDRAAEQLEAVSGG